MTADLYERHLQTALGNTLSPAAGRRKLEKSEATKMDPGNP
jgi:hypothetical protein